MNVKKLSLIGRKIYRYNDDIIINIPTLKQIRGENDSDEHSFWNEVNLFTQTPSDMISELDSMGIDFEEMSDYDLFILLFLMRKHSGMLNSNSMIFNNLNIWDLDVVEIEDSNKPIFITTNNKMIFNEEIFNDVSNLISLIAGHQKTKKKKFGNAYAKKKRIEQDYKNKEKLRNKAEKQSNILDGIILRLVCNANFPYNFETIQDVTIYDLIHSLKQIEKDIQVTDLMQSRLVGNDLSKLPQEQLSRFIL